MKKIILGLLLATATITQAQVKFAPGLRGGVNFAKLTDTDLDTKTDFYAGGYAGIQFSKHYTLQPELNYSRQGAKGDYRIYAPVYDNNGDLISEYESGSADVSLQYLSFGIINKFTIADRFSIMIGPTFDFLIDSNVDTESDADVAITGGFGCEIASGLGIEFRLKKGIASTVSEEYIDDSNWFEFDHATNFVLQLGLTYTFKKQ